MRPSDSYTFDFASAGLQGRWKLRDAWRQKDLGEFTGSFTTDIPFHGVILLRMSRSEEKTGN